MIHIQLLIAAVPLANVAELTVVKQEVLLWQRDSATRLSVEILQLHNIPFEN